MVERYGKDTAFFSTNCAMQTPLIKAVYDSGAIYPQPCCPSPYHGFPSALGIESAGYTVDAMANVISETAKKIDEKDMLGRFSTWPVPVAIMNTVVATEYANKLCPGHHHFSGEVSGDELDIKALEELMTEYNNGMTVTTSPYMEGSTEYPTYRMIMMDFLTYDKDDIL